MNRVAAGLLLALTTACAEAPTPSPLAPTSPPVLARTATEPTATFRFPVADGSLALRPDGLYSDGTSSSYAHGICGVVSTIYTGGSGDATMQTNNPQAADRKCAAYPRKMTLAYDDGVSETIPIYMNLNTLHNGLSSIAVGSTVQRTFAINPTQTTRCDILIFGVERKGVQYAADNVLVTRTSPDTWTVESQAAPSNRAYCTTSGRSHHMSVKFTIVSSRVL